MHVYVYVCVIICMYVYAGTGVCVYTYIFVQRCVCCGHNINTFTGVLTFHPFVLPMF